MEKNKKITLKTKFDFDSAHRLVGYKGKCKNLHGHVWTVNVTVIGNTNQLDSTGILWDFVNVKALKELLDHKTILKNCEENASIINVLVSTCGKDAVYLMTHNPTAEHLVEEILDLCKNSNPDLDYIIEIFESPKSSATGSTINEGDSNSNN